MVNYIPEKLLEFVRDGLVEQEHSGFFVHILSDGSIKKVGNDFEYPFFLRSCAKPLQASLLIDFEVDKFYDMTSDEIAICCASHAGENIHINTVKKLLNKIGLDETYLKCGLHAPLSKTQQKNMLLNHLPESTLYNNCSGKHTMMLAICKKMGVNVGVNVGVNDWNVNDYYQLEHPLQQAIKKKIYELCEVHTEYPVTKDGCGVPIFSMPLTNMVKGFMNLFLDEKYSKIKDAFVQNAYLIGGEDRFDTAIMGANPNLIAKVGACGLCIVINLEKKEGLIVKIADSDMKARAICMTDALHQLGWLTDKMLENEFLKAQTSKDILTLHGDKVGEAKICFKLPA